MKMIIICILVICTASSWAIIENEKGNGGDSIASTDHFLFVFKHRKLHLLDLFENGSFYYSVYDRNDGNILLPSKMAHMPYVEELSYVRPNICTPLKLKTIQCQSLTIKLYHILVTMPAYFQVLDKQMRQMTWELVDHNDEIQDEGEISDEIIKKIDNKFQLVVRNKNHVQIQRMGWLDDYLKYGKLDTLNKVATITHEVIYAITELQGDLNSKRARKINASLYRKFPYEEFEKSYTLLTSKVEKARHNEELDSFILEGLVKNAYAYDHNFALDEVDLSTVVEEYSCNSGFDNALGEYVQIYSLFDNTVRGEINRLSWFLRNNIVGKCPKPNISRVRLEDIMELIKEYKEKYGIRMIP